MSMSSVRADLDACLGVVERYRHILDTCMVSFIQDELFSRLPGPLSEELLALPDSQVAGLPSLLTRNDILPA